jgi:RsiW-degrading membrane proteinase PrsW (M82 family)
VKGRARQLAQQAITPGVTTSSVAVLRLLTPAGRAAAQPGLLGGSRVAPLFSDVATLGRSLQNTVVLLDPAVSREHARVVRAAEGWRVDNISERNPVWAGARLVEPGESSLIQPGEELRLGATALQLLAPRGEVSDAGGGAVQAAGGPTTSGGTHLLRPGITLQFAISGKRSARMWWLGGLLAVVVFLVCAVLTIGTAALVGRSALAQGGLRQVFAAITIPLVPALGVTLVAAAIDRYEREPWLLLAAAFLWGAVIAIPPVLLVEHALDATLVGGLGAGGLGAGGLLPALEHAGAQAAVAGITEEVFKGAGLVLLLVVLRDEFDNVTDGILYGLMIGAGFAMVENFVYFAVTPRGDLGFLILGRVVLGWLSHSTFTALIGAGLGYARESRRRQVRRLAPLIGFVAAIALHTLFDFVAFAATILASQPWAKDAPSAFGLATLMSAYAPLFLTQGVLLRIVLAALGREAEVVREYLVPEVIGGVVSSDEYTLVQNAALRGLAERRALVTYGPRAHLTVRLLHQTVTGLAFRRWHVAMGDPAKAADRQPEDAYRERIVRLRGSLLRQITEAETRSGALASGS